MTYPRPSEEAFCTLACYEPEKLVDWMRWLDSEDLTFAAEALGYCSNSTLVRSVLEPLLSHPDAIVREGAVLGLYRHRDESVDTALRLLIKEDPSSGVRSCAKDVLDQADI